MAAIDILTKNPILEAAKPKMSMLPAGIRQSSIQSSNVQYKMTPSPSYSSKAVSPITKLISNPLKSNMPETTTASQPPAASIGSSEDYHSFSAGMKRVGAVLNPFDWDRIKLVNPFHPERGGIDVTVPTKVLTIGAEIGTLAYGAGAIGAFGSGASLSAPGSASISPYLIGGAIGAGAVALMGSDQEATVTPTQNTNPIQQPQQNIIPQIKPETTISPQIYIPGSNNVVNQNTYSDVYNISEQLTNSYQINEQATTSNQITTTSQEGGISPLILLAGIALIALMK